MLYLCLKTQEKALACFFNQLFRLNWIFIIISCFFLAGLAGEVVECGGSPVSETECVGICCSKTGEVEAAEGVSLGRSLWLAMEQLHTSDFPLPWSVQVNPSPPNWGHFSSLQKMSGVGGKFMTAVKRQISHSSSRRVRKKIQKIVGCLSLPLSWGGLCTKYFKKLFLNKIDKAWNSQNAFLKNKLWLTTTTALSGEGTGAVNKGRTMEVAELGDSLFHFF